MCWKELHCLNKSCRAILGHIKGQRVIFDRILASQRRVSITCPECKRIRKIALKTKNDYLKYLTDFEKESLISEK